MKMALAIGRVLVRIRSSLFREKLRHEINDEIELHLELETRFIKSLLFEMGTLDIWTYATSLFALLAVSGIAVCLPAWRAGSIDPASVLRSD